MGGSKNFLKSLGIMGPLVSIVALLINQFLGWGVSDTEVTEIGGVLENLVNGNNVVDGILVLLGVATGIWGRIKAKAAVVLGTGTPVPTP